jgi:hypothetical protein
MHRSGLDSNSVIFHDGAQFEGLAYLAGPGAATGLVDGRFVSESVWAEQRVEIVFDLVKGLYAIALQDGPDDEVVGVTGPLHEDDFDRFEPVVQAWFEDPSAPHALEMGTVLLTRGAARDFYVSQVGQALSEKFDGGLQLKTRAEEVALVQGVVDLLKQRGVALGD